MKRLVQRLDRQFGIRQFSGIDVGIGINQFAARVGGDGIEREPVKIGVVVFEVHEAAWAEDLPEFFMKIRRSQAPVFLAGPGKRIGKRDPYLVHFTRSEKMIDDLDACAEESGVRDALFECIFSAFPETVAFDIHADKVSFRELPRQPDGIFAAAAGEFEGDWMVVPEMLHLPLAFQIDGLHTRAGERRLLYIVALVHVREGEYFGEFAEFVLARHWVRDRLSVICGAQSWGFWGVM